MQTQQHTMTRARRPAPAQSNGVERRAQGLGWFSIGLGVTQLVAPGGLARAIGATDDRRTRLTMQALGVREITSGVGILTRRQPAGWLWARVLGDVMDIALLSEALLSARSRKGRLVTATAQVAAIALLDAVTAVQLSRKRQERTSRAPMPPPSEGVHVSRSITIWRPREEVYRFWRNLENLPTFMAHLESVRQENGVSRWRAKAPAGTHVEWEAEITIDRPNETIAWRSLEGASVPNHGLVRFADTPDGKGTEIHVELRYAAPGGAVGRLIAKLFGEEPSQQISSDLRRLKQVLETGEVVHSDASIHRGMHPGRPSRESSIQALSRKRVSP